MNSDDQKFDIDARKDLAISRAILGTAHAFWSRGAKGAIPERR
jgi:hypothetical protein